VRVTPPVGPLPDQPPELRPPGSGQGGPPLDWGLQPPPQDRRRTLIRRRVTVGVVAILLIGCAGGLGVFFGTRDDGDPGSGGHDDGERRVDAYVDAFVAWDDPSRTTYLDDRGLTDADYPCVARAQVVTVGPENIPYTPAEIRAGAAADWQWGFTLSQARDIYDRLQDECGVDWRHLYLREMESQGVRGSELDCLDRILDDGLLRDLYATGFAGDQDRQRSAVDEVRAQVDRCLYEP
jgi:hypothetical protein